MTNCSATLGACEGETHDLALRAVNRGLRSRLRRSLQPRLDSGHPLMGLKSGVLGWRGASRLRLGMWRGASRLRLCFFPTAGRRWDLPTQRRDADGTSFPQAGRTRDLHVYFPPGRFLRKQSESSPNASASLIAERRDICFFPVSYALIVAWDMPARAANCFWVS